MPATICEVPANLASHIETSASATGECVGSMLAFMNAVGSDDFGTYAVGSDDFGTCAVGSEDAGT